MTDTKNALEVVCISFTRIHTEYLKKSFINAARDESYKDSDENIFIDKENHTKLIDLINIDREINSGHDNISSDLQDITEKVDNYLTSLQRRQGQTEKARKVFRSEKHFLTDWINRLRLSSELIENCLQPLIRIGECFLDSKDTDNYILFLINKCTVLSRISYLQKEFLETLKLLNGEIEKRSAFTLNGSFFFRLGTLNFSAHNYAEAREQLQLVVSKFEAKGSSLTGEEREMLFYAYLEIVMTYEFCGKYKEALAFLIDVSTTLSPAEICQKYIEIFEKNPEIKEIETLNFHSKDEIEKKRIIAVLFKILSKEDIIFPGRMAKFAVENRHIFSKRIEESNLAINNLVDEINFSDENAKAKVLAQYIQTVEQNQPLHDYLHLVAHCLNELGVELLKNFDLSTKVLHEELAHKTIILARALMLFVSESNNFYSRCQRYKSCFATVFAEAGDFDIANQELRKIIDDKDYPKLDVVSKAEIDFFAYRIQRMSRIASGVLDYLEDHTDTQYNHYLNLCYRLFDYDAIAHMALISFEYYLSTILHAGALETVALYFSDDTDECRDRLIRYGTFVAEAVGDSHNNWLTSECTKVQLIDEFLRSFFRSDVDSYTRDPYIYDIACKCLHYCNTEQNKDSDQVRFISFTSVQEVVSTLRDILPVDKYDDGEDYTELAIGSCSFYIIKSQTGLQKLPNWLKESNNMFFIYPKVPETDQIFEIPPDYIQRIRFFKGELEALKEFFLFCTFMQIRTDFTDPKSIFVLTPINNKGLCDYQVANFDTLLLDVSEKYSSTTQPKAPVNDQYDITVAGHAALSIEWLVRLKEYKDDIKWAVSFLVDTDDPRKNIRYSLALPDQKSVNAVMFRQSKCLKYLKTNFRFRTKKCDGCQSTRFCRIWEVEDSAMIEDLLLSFSEVPLTIRAPEESRGILLVWKQPKDAYHSYRMLFVKPITNTILEEEIRLALCNSGDDEIFESATKRAVPNWPDVCDTEKGNYLFICHSGRDDNLVKKELLDFFDANKVRFWYDHTKLIDADTWVDKIKKVIENKNCVGCVVLVTNHEFFKFPSIRKEFEILAEKKKELREGFTVMPVFYNLGTIENLTHLIESSFGFGDVRQVADQKTCQDLILPDPDHVSIWLNDWVGNSLSEYAKNEEGSGRKSSLLNACQNLAVIDD